MEWIKNNPDKVREMTEKLIKGNIGSKRTDESRKKISDALTGKQRTEEHTKNISLARKGQPSHMKGKTFSEQARKNIAEGIRKSTKSFKPVIQMDLSGNDIREWPSIKIAAEAVGIYPGVIGGCVRGVKSYKTAGGYRWRYK